MYCRIGIGILSSAEFITDWWFGTLFIFPYIGNNHPNWTFIFFTGVETTNQIRLRHYGLFRVLKPREPLDSPTLALSNGSNGGGTPRSLRTPSPSPRRRAESSELVDVEEVDEDEEEIPGRG